jgi:hypothetical protein
MSLTAMAGGCGDEDVLTQVERAQDAAGFPMLWLGRNYDGHELSGVTGDGDAGAVTYGDCEPAAEAGCPLPYELQQQDICEWEKLERRPPLRGGPGDSLLYDEGGGLVVLTGPTYVKIFGERPLAAARALRPLGDPDPLLRLPPPVTEVRSVLCEGS